MQAGKKRISYGDSFQHGYSYELRQPIGRKFEFGFSPELTPKQMLKLGVFGGAYFIGVRGLVPKDLPKDWFVGAKLSKTGKKEAVINFFKVSASQPLAVWKNKGWVRPQDPHGWFQWYCRYYLGRRSEDDARQIKRWKAMSRHIGQLRKYCRKGDFTCRPRQRQAQLHWAYDSRKY